MPVQNKHYSKPKRLVCPCCGQERNLVTGTPLLKMQARFSHGWLTEGWAERYAEGSFYHWRGMQWACNHCLQTGRALPGQPGLQTFCDHPPYLAYFDKSYTCTDCHTPFTFSAEEQRYWYEQLKFWVQSVPKQCASCRKQRRQRNEATRTLQQKLQALPHKPADQQAEQLREIATLYTTIGNSQKATFYQRQAEKKSSIDNHT